MTGVQAPAGTRTVLVADPDPDVRALVTLTLDGGTYRVIESHDAESGLLAIARHIPALVLVDMSLPGASGLAISHSLKAQPETRGVRVVVLYPRGTPVDHRRGRSAGVDAWLAKPFTAFSLLHRVESLLSAEAAEV